ncbi:hypothetical protein CK203_003884 [Vitis vinifera]|uniref:Uncharacterized protein n=1 Tax=Vitis vinifera TaxID=29760 RepID=A0A438K8K5_VITVI|nr:hypothetical protein CK203_003884 [Vitis vinifera]
MRLEKWSQRMGCLMEGEREREAWVRIVGLPISLWDRDILSKIGEGCGGFLDIDVKTERMEELQWARILVRIKGEKIPNMVEIWVENMCYSLALWWETRPMLRALPTDERGKPFVTAGEVEGEVQSREGKRVMEAEGGPRLEDQTQSADGTRRLTSGSPRPMDHFHGLDGSHLGPQGVVRVQGRPLEMGLLEKPCGPVGLDPSSSSVDSFGPKEMVDLRRTKAWRTSEGVGLVADGQSPSSVEPNDHFGEAQSYGPSHSGSPFSEIPLFWEKDGLRRLSEAEILHKERSKTDLALVEEALRYDSVSFQSGCLVSGPLSIPSSFTVRLHWGSIATFLGMKRSVMREKIRFKYSLARSPLWVRLSNDGIWWRSTKA